jgi:hypothetical protein
VRMLGRVDVLAGIRVSVADCRSLDRLVERSLKAQAFRSACEGNAAGLATEAPGATVGRRGAASAGDRALAHVENDCDVVSVVSEQNADEPADGCHGCSCRGAMTTAGGF